MNASDQRVFPFLMFSGRAEEAMNYYTSLFTPAEIRNITRYGANETGAEGMVQHATFSIKGQAFMCIDSNMPHAFTFTPAISVFVVCDTAQEIEQAFAQLAQDGTVLMPLGTYPFSQQYGWVQDKFGVSWQLNRGELEKK